MDTKVNINYYCLAFMMETTLEHFAIVLASFDLSESFILI